jgi:DNA-binding response OmpR family regulator
MRAIRRFSNQTVEIIMLVQEPHTDAALDSMPYVQPRARILIVDDESRIRLTLRSCLEAEGYDVEEARDGAEAIRAVIDTRPDLMLLDLAMPRLDGMGTLRELHAHFKALLPRIVILTAWGSPAAEEEAFLYGVSDFLQKPLVPAVLRVVVDRVLREHPSSAREFDSNPDDPGDDDRPFGHLYFG